MATHNQDIKTLFELYDCQPNQRRFEKFLNSPLEAVGERPSGELAFKTLPKLLDVSLLGYLERPRLPVAPNLASHEDADRAHTGSGPGESMLISLPYALRMARYSALASPA